MVWCSFVGSWEVASGCCLWLLLLRSEPILLTTFLQGKVPVGMLRAVGC